MKITTVLFDLDGTLLPMDQELFVKAYFKGLAAKLMPHGYDPQALIDAIWKGTAVMVRNDGSRTNEEAFWNYFASLFGEDARKDEPKFREFYETEFQNVQKVCGYTPAAREIIDLVKDLGFRAVLATNPIFPPSPQKAGCGGQASPLLILNSTPPTKTALAASPIPPTIRRS